jgi:cysteine-rich repeat protein
MKKWLFFVLFFLVCLALLYSPLPQIYNSPSDCFSSDSAGFVSHTQIPGEVNASYVYETLPTTEWKFNVFQNQVDVLVKRINPDGELSVQPISSAEASGSTANCKYLTFDFQREAASPTFTARLTNDTLNESGRRECAYSLTDADMLKIVALAGKPISDYSDSVCSDLQTGRASETEDCPQTALCTVNLAPGPNVKYGIGLKIDSCGNRIVSAEDEVAAAEIQTKANNFIAACSAPAKDSAAKDKNANARGNCDVKPGELFMEVIPFWNDRYQNRTIYIKVAQSPTDSKQEAVTAEKELWGYRKAINLINKGSQGYCTGYQVDYQVSLSQNDIPSGNIRMDRLPPTDPSNPCSGGYKWNDADTELMRQKEVDYTFYWEFLTNPQAICHNLNYNNGVWYLPGSDCSAATFPCDLTWIVPPAGNVKSYYFVLKNYAGSFSLIPVNSESQLNNAVTQCANSVGEPACTPDSGDGSGSGTTTTQPPNPPNPCQATVESVDWAYETPGGWCSSPQNPNNVPQNLLKGTIFPGNGRNEFSLLDKTPVRFTINTRTVGGSRGWCGAPPSVTCTIQEPEMTYVGGNSCVREWTPDYNGEPTQVNLVFNAECGDGLSASPLTGYGKVCPLDKNSGTLNCGEGACFKGDLQDQQCNPNSYRTSAGEIFSLPVPCKTYFPSGYGDLDQSKLVRCGSDCRLDLSECEKPKQTCGNNKVEGDEECDDNNVRSGDGCSSDCKNETLKRLPLNLMLDTKTCRIYKEIGNDGTYFDFATQQDQLQSYIAQHNDIHQNYFIYGIEGFQPWAGSRMGNEFIYKIISELGYTLKTYLQTSDVENLILMKAIRLFFENGPHEQNVIIAGYSDGGNKMYRLIPQQLSSYVPPASNGRNLNVKGIPTYYIYVDATGSFDFTTTENKNIIWIANTYATKPDFFSGLAGRAISHPLVTNYPIPVGHLEYPNRKIPYPKNPDLFFQNVSSILEEIRSGRPLIRYIRHECTKTENLQLKEQCNSQNWPASTCTDCQKFKTAWNDVTKECDIITTTTVACAPGELSESRTQTPYHNTGFCLPKVVGGELISSALIADTNKSYVCSGIYQLKCQSNGQLEVTKTDCHAEDVCGSIDCKADCSGQTAYYKCDSNLNCVENTGTRRSCQEGDPCMTSGARGTCKTSGSSLTCVAN